MTRPWRKRTTADELRQFLAPDFAKWWLPDRFRAYFVTDRATL